MTEILDLINPPPPKSARGKVRHAVYKHMENTERHGVVTSWQVWRHGKLVAVGFSRRASALREALRLNVIEFGEPPKKRRRGGL